MTPDVSVIIPTYNRSALVAKAIQSLQGSGVERLEIVIADDGSTDDTEAVARRYPGVVYARQSNAGPAKARNTGFAASSGRYVCFLDSDDEWIAGEPQRLVRHLDAHRDVAAVFADARMGNPASGFTSFVEAYGGAAFHALPHEARPGVRVFARDPFFRQLSIRNVMFLGSLLIRREAFADVGQFEPTLRGAADWEFFMRLTLRSVVAFSEGPATSVYLKHDDGMSTDVDHMEKDFILALAAIRRHPPLTAAQRRHVEEQLRRHVFGWAYLAYDARDFAGLRARLRLGLELGQWGPREAAFFALSHCPGGFITFLRSIRHGLAAIR